MDSIALKQYAIPRYNNRWKKLERLLGEVQFASHTEEKRE